MTKKRKTAFISSSDSNYFPLLLEWVHSLRAHPQSKGMDICIMNAGMSAEQLDKLRPHVTKIVEAEWPCKIAAHKIRGREYLKACVARPWIPEYFPEYDTYFWMDADTWVQNWDAVELFLEGASRKKICLTGQVDRAYPRQIRLKWLWRWPWKVRGFYFSNARKAFGFKTARELLPYHVLLAGAFCLDKDAPHWVRWQALSEKPSNAARSLRRSRLRSACCVISKTILLKSCRDGVTGCVSSSRYGTGKPTNLSSLICRIMKSASCTFRVLMKCVLTVR